MTERTTRRRILAGAGAAVGAALIEPALASAGTASVYSIKDYGAVDGVWAVNNFLSSRFRGGFAGVAIDGGREMQFANNWISSSGVVSRLVRPARRRRPADPARARLPSGTGDGAGRVSLPARGRRPEADALRQGVGNGHARLGREVTERGR